MPDWKPVIAWDSPLRCRSARRAQSGKAPLPRTPDGHPDLQGIWDFRSATPLERPARFAGREFMTPEEVVEYERLALAREDGRPPDDARSLEEQSVHPVWWLDYGKKVVKTARTSLIVDPPDGKMPPMTAEGASARPRAAPRPERMGRPILYENRSLMERCITRGLPEVTLPGPYNNNLQIVQTPGYVAAAHGDDSRRARHSDGWPSAPARTSASWMGDSRGRWEGDTLVIDTTNFTDRTNFRGSGANLHLVERLTRVDADTIEYRFTVEDPTTWTRPWTVAYPMVKTDGPIYEFACHEGNYGLRDILTGARYEEESGGRGRTKEITCLTRSCSARTTRLRTSSPR